MISEIDLIKTRETALHEVLNHLISKSYTVEEIVKLAEVYERFLTRDLDVPHNTEKTTG